MAFNILHRRIYLVRLIYDWSRSDLPEEPRKESVALPSPVIYIQKGVPAEDQFGIWLLLDVRLQRTGIEPAVVLDFHSVLCKPVLPVLQNTRRAAGK